MPCETPMLHQNHRQNLDLTLYINFHSAFWLGRVYPFQISPSRNLSWVSLMRFPRGVWQANYISTESLSSSTTATSYNALNKKYEKQKVQSNLYSALPSFLLSHPSSYVSLNAEQEARLGWHSDSNQSQIFLSMKRGFVDILFTFRLLCSFL